MNRIRYHVLFGCLSLLGRFAYQAGARVTSGHPGFRSTHRLARAAGLAAFLIGFALLYLIPLFFSLPEKLKHPPEPGQYFTDRNGKPLRRLLKEDLAIDSPATLDEIPAYLIEATLAVEDARFRKHNGIDAIGIIRAAYDSLHAGRLVSGASTISQQLIKITSPEKPRTLRTKITEIFTARKLEMSRSKDEILTDYLNRLPYGNLLTGCRAASRGYFDKPLSDLSLAECSLLAGLPNRPSYLNPHRHFEAAKKRQAWVLRRMLTTGRITHEEYQHAIAQPLQLQDRSASAFEAPHLVDLIRYEKEASGMDTPPPIPHLSPDSQNPTTPVRTTIDLYLQHAIEQSIRTHLQYLEQQNGHGPSLQAASVVIDNASGEVLALVGSRDYFHSEGGQINGAWTARSPGSALKPFTYLLALEQGKSAATVLDDLPLEFMTPTGAYRPVNFDRRFRGPVTLREALATSLNVPAIRLLNEMGGPGVLHSAMLDLGLTTLTRNPSHYGLGLTIGTAEVRLLELTNAYACLARLGRYGDYTLTRRESTAPLPTRPLFDPDACYILADILSDRQARVSAFGLNSSLNLPFRVACKTGTSTDFRDNWTIGFTPQYTVGVWVGCFDNQTMPRISGVIGAGPIFHDIFMQLHSSNKNKQDKLDWYPRPDRMVIARIDPLNGKRLPADTDGGNSVKVRHNRMERFLPSHHPPLATEKDYDHQGRTYLPQRYARWFAAGHHALQNRAAIIPPNRDISHDHSFNILSPLPDTIIYLDDDLPHGGRHFTLRTSAPSQDVIWSSPTLSIDSSHSPPVAILSSGKHQLTARSTVNGDSRSVTVIVERL